jgi:hypothetical protein
MKDDAVDPLIDEVLNRFPNCNADVRASIAEELNEKTPRVWTAVQELGFDNSIIRSNLYRCFARVHCYIVLQYSTTVLGVGGDATIESLQTSGGKPDTIKALKVIEAAAKTIEDQAKRLRASRQNAEVEHDAKRSLALERIENSLQSALGQRSDTESAGETDLFDLPPVAKVMQALATAARQEAAAGIQKIRKRRLQGRIMFVKDLALVWESAKGAKPSAHKNNEIDGYVSPFGRFVAAAWPEGLGNSPSDDTIKRYMTMPQTS